MESLDRDKKKELAHSVLRSMSRANRAMAKDGKGMGGMGGGGRQSGEDFDAELEEAPKEIVKEGLSEYFIYTIEGTETIPNGWAKRLRSFDAAAVPVKIQYRYRPAEYGEQLVRMYVMTNDKDSKLGTTPLPDGTFRLFRGNCQSLPSPTGIDAGGEGRRLPSPSGRGAGGEGRSMTMG